MSYFIETNMGFDHGSWWWGNINPAELTTFETIAEAEERRQELLELPEVKWAEIRS
jgi:hypothetical protein